MFERTEDEKSVLALKAVVLLSREAATLWQEGHKKAAAVLIDYLVTATTEDLVLFYDTISSFEEEQK